MKCTVSARRRVRLPLPMLALLLATLSIASPSAAQSLDSIADDLASNGVYSDFDLDADVEAAVGRANAAGAAFVWLDQSGSDGALLAQQLQERVAGRGFDTVILLTNGGAWGHGSDNRAPAAADAAFGDFAAGNVAAGLDTFTNVLNGGESGDTASAAAGSDTATSSGTSSGATTTSSSSGGGVPWLTILLLGVIGFFLFRFIMGRRRTAAAQQQAIAEDKAEIREQLRNNADAVIDLGDRIATADDELRRLYEQASRSFTEVSQGIDDADTPEEIDNLDDKLDEAEWQFQVIEARLDGRTPPPRPELEDDLPPPPTGGGQGTPAPRTGAPRPDGRQPVPPLGDGRIRSRRQGPALGADESIFTGGAPRTTSRQAPTPRPSRRQRSGGGMLGGAMKAGLGSLLLRMLLGGGLGALGGSRRTQRRTRSRSGGGYGGGLGGGVLRGR